MEIEDPNHIIGFTRTPCYTSIDYRSRLALAADEVANLRDLCANIDSLSEFQWTVVALIQMLMSLNTDVRFK